MKLQWDWLKGTLVEVPIGGLAPTCREGEKARDHHVMNDGGSKASQLRGQVGPSLVSCHLILPQG